MDKIPKVILMFSWPKNINELFSNVYQLSAILKIQDGRHSGCTIANIFSIKTNKNILFVDNPPFSGSRNHINPAQSLVDIYHLGFRDGWHRSSWISSCWPLIRYE